MLKVHELKPVNGVIYQRYRLLFLLGAGDATQFHYLVKYLTTACIKPSKICSLFLNMMQRQHIPLFNFQ